MHCQQWRGNITNCYSNDSDNPHCRRVTPLLRVTRCVRLAGRLHESQGVSSTCPLKCPFPLVDPDLHLTVVPWAHTSSQLHVPNRLTYTVQPISKGSRRAKHTGRPRHTVCSKLATARIQRCLQFLRCGPTTTQSTCSECNCYCHRRRHR